MNERRRVPTDVLAAAVTLLACAGVLAALGLGWLGPARWLPVAGFLSAASLCGGYEVVASWRARLRTRRLRARSIPRGTILRRPRWLVLKENIFFGWAAGVLGAIASVFGFPGVGVGLALALIMLFACATLMSGGLFVADLSFEDEGLRLGARAVSFLVPWSAIIAVERLGTDSLWLRIARTETLLTSALPDTAEARARVRRMLFDASGPETRLMLNAWTGGLDAHTLARAIEEARSGRVDQPN